MSGGRWMPIWGIALFCFSSPDEDSESNLPPSRHTSLNPSYSEFGLISTEGPDALLNIVGWVWGFWGFGGHWSCWIGYGTYCFAIECSPEGDGVNGGSCY